MLNSFFLDAIAACLILMAAYFLLLGISTLAGAKLKHFAEILSQEFKDLKAGLNTTQRMNAFAIIAVALLGALLVAASLVHEFTEIVKRVIGAQQAQELKESSSMLGLVFALSFVSIASLAINYAFERLKRRQR